ncbi:related to ubiquinol cytochrome c reductase 8.5 kDa subunit [Ramularia collo-cygni]|uniref:Related to ubiquinol cytochrome c reductase 8.5 kDa subunit n=1 Tax=Ramularia collo-cygni TaxID=112498 RepID=A0A2D3V317_9PEZI|nr:related to ubiquinol cytochrome c reductase 8.5 kDa subunit [Ramularia collo-cygni]CZT19077.1 related to ubiquinol cytochrome c reductase 8.5 kDa subunit [Ramularia collo-cygni]
MQPTLLRRSGGYLGNSGKNGIQPWKQPVSYETFRSKYGPQYKAAMHVGGMDKQFLVRAGYLAAGFGASAGVFLIFFFDGLPRLQKDVLGKIPFLSQFYNKEIAPEDNPF